MVTVVPYFGQVIREYTFALLDGNADDAIVTVEDRRVYFYECLGAGHCEYLVDRSDGRIVFGREYEHLKDHTTRVSVTRERLFFINRHSRGEDESHICW